MFPTFVHGKTTGVLKDGRKKVHTEREDGTEWVEEFDLRTEELLVRKWRTLTKIGTKPEEADWHYEIGEPARAFNPNTDLLSENVNNPVFLRQDQHEHFVWRVRNVPYPREVYHISVDPTKTKIIIRTTNKKYFKQFEVPDMACRNLLLDAGSLSFEHANNTLIIRYKKPPVIMEVEECSRQERMQLFAQPPVAI